MALKRIIPLLLYDGMGLLKTIKFKNPSYVGDPINAIKIYNEKEVDELILIDTMASKQKRKPNFNKIADIASETFMPFAYGGGVKTYDDFATLYKLGIEKIIVNSLIQENPKIIIKVIEQYGSQSVIASVDYKRGILGGTEAYSYIGYKIKHSISEYVLYLCNQIGVGEIMLQSVDHEGTWDGFDYETTKRVAELSPVPIIASGGCGKTDDLKKVLYDCNAQAAAIGSMAVYSKKGMGVLISFPNRNQVIIE